MKSSIFAVLVLLVGQNSVAGDAGYFSRTCVSASQRTVLTNLNDYTQDASVYTLILDGVPAVYNLNDATVKTTGDDGILTISKNNVDAFKSEFNAKTNKLNLTIYVDPRLGTIAEHQATPTPIKVQLQCKDFWPNP